MEKEELIPGQWYKATNNDLCWRYKDSSGERHFFDYRYYPDQDNKIIKKRTILIIHKC